MNIIFEGIDRSGKSSVISEFLKYQDLYCSRAMYTTIHFSAPPDTLKGKKLSNNEKMYYIKRSYYSFAKFLSNSDNVLCDRFHLGEAIYAPIYRNYYPTYIRDLECTLNDNNNSLLVLLYCSKDTIIKRFDNKGIDISDISKILKMYKQEYNKSVIKHKLSFNSDKMSSFDIFTKIMKYTNRIKA